MPKRDYYNDPTAPRANSIVVAVMAVVRNEDGEVLLIQRTDNDLWAAPGGAQDIGESVIGAVEREVREETGLEVEVTGFSGIYSDPAHVIAYDDGEVRQEFSLCFHAHPTGGEIRPSSESRQVYWVTPDRLYELDIHSTMRKRLLYAVENPAIPHIG